MSAIDELVYVLQEAFSGAGIEQSNEGQSFMQNLLSVEGSMWRTVPERGVRTIESIALHVGSCKVMYDEYAFGPGRLSWGDTEVQPWPTGEAPFEETIGWLHDVHDRFVNTSACSETTIWLRRDRRTGESSVRRDGLSPRSRSTTSITPAR